MASQRQLDFCIPGAQKSGTTALVRYLDQHPGLFFPQKKELHLFNRSAHLPWAQRRAPDEKIAEHFISAQEGQLCGESTPAYMYWRDSWALMAEHNPDMKLIICLRHPAIRAASAWRMEVSRGRETLSFSQAIRDGRNRVSAAPHGQHKTFSYVERGFYASQIKELYQWFDRSSIFLIRSDQVFAESRKIQDILRFLGVSAIDFKPERKNLFGHDAPDETICKQSDLSYLHSLYYDDMCELADLTGLEIQDWLDNIPSISALNWSYAAAP